MKLEGLDLDAVYENIVRQIAGDVLKNTASEEPESLKKSIERNKRQQALQKQIDALQKKVCREKQLNRQMELNAELKKLKRELQQLL